MLNGTTLTKENRIKYLGAILGNDGSATHVAQRVKAANGSYFKLQAAGMHGGGLSPDAIRHMYTLAIQPNLTYGTHAIHLKKTDLQLLEKAHARIIKTSLGLSKFSKTNPLLTALNIQRLESVVKVQTLNLLMRCMSGDSLASMFYWTIYKRGDTEGKTLMGRSHTILQQYGLTLNKAIFNDIFRINNKTVIYEQYSYGQNGLVDSLRAIFNDYTFDNKRYAQMLLRF